MNRTGLFQGLHGTRAVVPNQDLAAGMRRTGKSEPTNRNTDIGYSGYPTPPKQFSGVLDYSTRNQVLPCEGYGRFVLRAPPQYNAQHGLMPVGGNGRTTAKSMVNPRPLNLPIQVPRSNFHAGLPSRLGIPSITVR